MTTDPPDWPKIFAERGIGPSSGMTWTQVHPGCWVGWGGDETTTAVHVVAVAQGAVGPIMTTLIKSAEGAREMSWQWLRMHDALADTLRSAGLKVGCAADGCEYDRWPCPVRVAGAHPAMLSPDGWQNHYPGVRG